MPLARQPTAPVCFLALTGNPHVVRVRWATVEEITAYIALGANLGNRARVLMQAAKMIDDVPGVEVQRISSLYDTEPLGGPCGQPEYCNGVVEIRTSLAPERLLRALQEIETTLGRDRENEQRFGPRTCDLDILMMGRIVLETDALTIPHRRMCERAFVLVPLAEIAPDAVHPVTGKTTMGLLAALCGRDEDGT